GPGEALSAASVGCSGAPVQSEPRGRRMRTPAYPISVFWSDEDDAWVADVPDLVYCSAFGDTPHEAVAEAERAVQAWLDAARESGRPIPPPSRHPIRA